MEMEAQLYRRQFGRLLFTNQGGTVFLYNIMAKRKIFPYNVVLLINFLNAE
jgi:hypothetical protein